METMGERRRRILKAVVESYLQTGTPVGSKTIAEQFGGSVSSATIRNEMAELTRQGFMEQPHTSAGRIPSTEGLQLYVSCLMEPEPIPDRVKNAIDSLFIHGVADTAKVVEHAAALLSELTNYAAIGSTPVNSGAKISRTELFPVSDGMVAVAVITTEGEFRTGLCRVELNEHEQNIIAAFITRELQGLRLTAVDMPLMNSIAAKCGQYTMLTVPILQSILTICEEMAHSKILLEGQANLLRRREEEGAATFEALKLLSDRKLLSSLLDSAGGGITVRIGSSENDTDVGVASLITAKYLLNDDSFGCIGVVGPVRMDYASVISYIEYFAGTLGKLLKESDEE